MKPIIKWAGGKSSMLSKTLPFFPKTPYRRYIEPFLGGGAFAWHLAPPRAQLSDANAELINLYAKVRDQPSRLTSILSGWAADYDQNPRETYLRARVAFNEALGGGPDGSLLRAGLFLFLNKTCFNGLWRVNKSGQFNVPFGGRNKCPQLYDGTNLAALGEYLNRPGVELAVRDFRDSLRQCGEGDLVYLDEPYYGAGFTGYTSQGYHERDHLELLALCVEGHAKGATFVASHHCGPEHFSGWRHFMTERSTSVSGFSSARKRTVENVYVLSQHADTSAVR